MGDFDRAREEFQNILTTTNDEKIQAEALIELGKISYLSRNYEQAIKELTQGITQNPQSKNAGTAMVNTWLFH